MGAYIHVSRIIIIIKICVAAYENPFEVAGLRFEL
jgi:hypothetical protein